jgi:2,3-bisphosphoglycerate-dependent phosphoglycerate mutase
MALFLIRHGETPSNAARIVQVPGIGLSERGIAQAERLAERLAGLGVAAILSSDLPRARMTAERIAASTGAPFELRADLQERNFGDIRGTPYSELGFDLYGADYAPPNGETWAEFHRRVAVAWPLLAERATRTVGNLAVVTHGLVCHSLVTHHLRLPEGRAPALPWSNASLTIVEPAPPWEVRLLNCTAHLDRPTGQTTAV